MRAILSIVAVSLLSAAPAVAGVPKELTIQGVLRDPAGQLQTVPVNVIVRLFDAQTAGTQYGSDYTASGVPASGGLFTITIPAPTLPSDLASAGALWLELVVNGDAFPRYPVQTILMAQTGSLANDTANLGGTLAASYLKQSVGDGRYLGKTATAADSAMLGGVAAASYLTTAAGDARYLGILATAADTAKLGGLAVASYQKRVAGTCTGNNYIQSILAAGTVGCGNATNGTVTSVTGTAPLSVTNSTTTPAISLSGTLSIAQGEGRWGGYYRWSGPDATNVQVCPAPPATTCSWCDGAAGNPLASFGAGCPSGFSAALVRRAFDATYTYTHCLYQCYR